MPKLVMNVMGDLYRPLIEIILNGDKIIKFIIIIKWTLY